MIRPAAQSQAMMMRLADASCFTGYTRSEAVKLYRNTIYNPVVTVLSFGCWYIVTRYTVGSHGKPRSFAREARAVDSGLLLSFGYYIRRFLRVRELQLGRPASNHSVSPAPAGEGLGSGRRR